MKIKIKNIQQFTKHKYMRIDSKYWETVDKLNYSEKIKLKNLFEIVNGTTQTKYYTQEKTEIPYVRIGDMKSKGDVELKNIIYLSDDVQLLKEKLIIEDDLLIAMIGSTVGKVSTTVNVIGGCCSNNISILRKKDLTEIQKKYYTLLLQSNFFYQVFLRIAAQKAQPNLSEYDLAELLLPIIPESKMKEVLKKIEPLQQKIIQKKSELPSLEEVINSTFEKYFGIERNEYIKIDKIKIKNTSLNDYIKKNENLRNSVRFYKAQLIQNYLQSKICCVSLGKYILNTQNGWSPNCNIESSKFMVLSLECINSNGKLSLNSEKFSDFKEESTDFLSNNDFLVSRGNTPELVGLASVAQISEEMEEQIIYPDIMIKVTLSDEINKLYLAYLFNSFIGRYYFKYISKGKNISMVKISKKELNDFLIPKVSKKIQDEIVEVIEKKVKEREKIENDIQNLELEISNIIVKSIN